MQKASTAGHRAWEEVTLVRIEAAMIFAAHIVQKYGDTYAPILDSLIADHDEAQHRGTPLNRAQRVLNIYGKP